MLLQAAELSPSQKAAFEELMGRKLLDQETLLLCASAPRGASTPEQRAAMEQRRQLLEAADCSQRRITDEEYEASLLETAEHE